MPVELRSYVRNDVHSGTDLCVLGDRVNSPRGTLVHTTSGTNSREWLQGGSCTQGNPAGADALIGRDGHQYILSGAKTYAYHAGNSRLYLEGPLADDEVSEALVGVELECTQDQAPTFEQYDSLADLIVLYGLIWAWRWPYIIYGHYSVARPIGRRSDPVNFDWGTLMGRLYVRSMAAKVPGLVGV